MDGIPLLYSPQLITSKHHSHLHNDHSESFSTQLPHVQGVPSRYIVHDKRREMTYASGYVTPVSFDSGRSFADMQRFSIKQSTLGGACKKAPIPEGKLWRRQGVYGMPYPNIEMLQCRSGCG